MPNKDTAPTVAQTPTQRPIRDRVGLALYGRNAAGSLSTIAVAEAAGVRQIWMTQTTPAPGPWRFAAATVQTSNVRLGTAIVPTYPRHPLSSSTASSDDQRPCSRTATVGSRAKSSPNHRGCLRHSYDGPS